MQSAICFSAVMSEEAVLAQGPPAGPDWPDTAATPPVTSAAMPSTTAVAPTSTAMPSMVTMPVTTTTAVTTATTVEMAVPVKGTKSKKSRLKCACPEKPVTTDSASQQETSGTDHPEDPSAWASTLGHDTDGGEESVLTQAESQDTETASGGVESTAVPPPPPPSTQEPAATARETQAAADKDVQAVADLLVAEGLDGLPSNISTLGRSAPTSSGGSMPQYFDLSGQKVMPTRHEDWARDLFHGPKVTPIMLQVETVSAVNLPEGCRGKFVLDHTHLHLLDRIQSWCDEDVSNDHPEVTRMQQPDGTWSFMADGVVQLILQALGLLPHTSMIQMGDESTALSVGVLPVEPPVTILVTTAMDGVPTVVVQANPGEPWSDSNLSREERGPEVTQEQDEQTSAKGPEATQGQDEQTPAKKEVWQTGGDTMEEEPVKKAKK